MTQKARVKKVLEDAGPRGVSSKWFIENYLPRAAARVQDLKDEGVEVTSTREGKYTRWTLLVGVGTVEQGGHVAPVGRERAPGFCRRASEPQFGSVDSGKRRGAVPSMFDYDADWESAA